MTEIALLQKIFRSIIQHIKLSKVLLDSKPNLLNSYFFAWYLTYIVYYSNCFLLYQMDDSLIFWELLDVLNTWFWSGDGGGEIVFKRRFRFWSLEVKKCHFKKFFTFFCGFRQNLLFKPISFINCYKYRFEFCVDWCYQLKIFLPKILRNFEK